MPPTIGEWILILDDGRSRAYLRRKEAPAEEMTHVDRMWKQVAINPTVGVASYVPTVHE